MGVCASCAHIGLPRRPIARCHAASEQPQIPLFGGDSGCGEGGGGEGDGDGGGSDGDGEATPPCRLLCLCDSTPLAECSCPLRFTPLSKHVKGCYGRYGDRLLREIR